MGRLLRSLRHGLTVAVRWPLVSCLLLAGLAIGGYHAVRLARFEYHYQQAGKALFREAFTEAGGHLAICLRLDPDSGAAHFRAARVARRSGQLELAEEELTACEDLDWNPQAVQLERAMLAVQRDEFTAADERLLREALAANTPSRFEVLEALALGYMRAYQLTAALRCLDDWVEGQPHSAGALLRRGWVHERLDRTSDAEKDYRRVVELLPGHREAKLRLASILRQHNKAWEATPLFEELLADGPDPAALLGLAQCQVALGKTAEARRLFDQLAQERPNDPGMLLERGKLDLSEGRLAEAKKALHKATVASPRAYEPHYQLFLCLLRLGERDEAARVEEKVKTIEADLKQMAELTESLQRRPNDLTLRFQVAEVFLRSGEESEAAHWLEGVLRLDPRNARALRLLADICDRAGRPHEARLHRLALARLGE